MFPVLNIGPLAIQTPLLLLLLGFWVASILAEREAEQRQLPPNEVSGVLTVAVVAGIISGRIIYIFRFWEAFQKDLWGIISLNPATIDGVGAVIGGLIGATYYWYRKGLPGRRTADAFALPMSIMVAAMGTAFLASGAFYGLETSSTWGIELWGLVRHPTQLYLLAAGLFGAGVSWWFRKRSWFDGFLAALWLVLMSTGLLIIEGFRGNSQLIYGGIRLWQVVYLLMGLTGLLTIHFNLRSESSRPPANLSK